ncbi:hypothetical protein NECAME_16021 [Necator americanus]|uniref:Uncharacterized protein n=1 Tax=Necator americanus TaxID=51031 RepID=W2TY27_NECAM|nr:hypothetical protein NECAME_16021 [Necator americanus]ETN86970.1 hypothetical protein NECAME_16021 [Necator americanus]
MWSAEFLDNVESSLRSSPLSNELADSWAREYTAEMPDIFSSMESEWETIQRNIALSQQEEAQKVENDIYVHQVRFILAPYTRFRSPFQILVVFFRNF